MRNATLERLSNKIQEMVEGPEALQATIELKERIKKILLRNKLLSSKFSEIDLDDMTKLKKGSPYFQLLYRQKISSVYALDLVFPLENHKLKSIVRLTPQGPDAGHALVHEQVFTYFNVDGLVKQGLEQSVDMRVQLMQDMGIEVIRPTLKKLLKAAYAGNKLAV